MKKPGFPKIIPAVKPGWFEVLPRRTLDRGIALHAALSHVWLALLSCVILFRPTKFAPPGAIWYGVTAAAIILTIFPVILVRRILLKLRSAEARVFISVDRIVLGQPFACLVQQAFQAKTHVDSFVAEVACRCTEEVYDFGQHSNQRGTTSSIVWSHLVAGIVDRAIEEDEALEVHETLLLPIEQMPSTPLDKHPPHRYAWIIVVNSALRLAPDYSAEFPIQVVRPRHGPLTVSNAAKPLPPQKL